ncbi:50S ribosomal protein L13 [Patescibacteria group bacterium]|nr:50S ribosomal protein L13 [Patescibacteria group bacterium]MBU1906742.1 50S ribosomal protein L13 [Patescibacteria group bacterium]
MALKVEQKVHQIDAAGKAPGRLASEVARLLQGKHKPAYQPHVDMGDTVVISNIADMKITGKKLEQKEYIRHTNYPGGIKRTPMSKLMANDPGEVLRKAVSRMLPDNKLRKGRMKRLVIKK